jgi:hypothetical protein
MKMEPVKAFEVDPSKPSLKGLSYFLRRPELWPEGFVWNYGDYRTCAVGLAYQLWGIHLDNLPKVFNIPYGSVDRLFFSAATKHDTINVTPLHIADDIDAFLGVEK